MRHLILPFFSFLSLHILIRVLTIHQQTQEFFCLLSVDVCRMGANLKSVSTDCISTSVASSVSSADVVGGISLPYTSGFIFSSSFNIESVTVF
ncbi:hypothetical protein Hanom_Chr08g00749751 [Helianthus anomalus]